MGMHVDDFLGVCNPFIFQCPFCLHIVRPQLNNQYAPVFKSLPLVSPFIYSITDQQLAYVSLISYKQIKQSFARVIYTLALLLDFQSLKGHVLPHILQCKYSAKISVTISITDPCVYCCPHLLHSPRQAKKNHLRLMIVGKSYWLKAVEIWKSKTVCYRGTQIM